MIELMAIFIELKCDAPVNYLPRSYNPADNSGETPHYRAEKLLRRLETREQYAKMSASQQWALLINFSKHEQLQGYIGNFLK